METRERLLEAAIRMLSEHGYARTTTRQIVEAADAHLPSVNYFFGSKENLMNEAVAASLTRWTEGAIGVVEAVDAGHPRERLRVGLERCMMILAEDRHLAIAAIEAFAQAERNDELRQHLARAYEAFREQIARAATGGSTDSNSAEMINLASILIALFDGLALQWVLSPDGVPDADSLMSSLDLLAQLIAEPDE